MLHLYKNFGKTIETVDHVMPGAAGCYAEVKQNAAKLVLIGCFENDLGGDVRIIDKEVYDATHHGQQMDDDFMDKTSLLHTISFCGRVELAISSGPSGMLIAKHVPGHYN